MGRMKWERRREEIGGDRCVGMVEVLEKFCCVRR